MRQRRKEARPGELLEAALEVFADKGFAAARMDDIARRAGVSKGTVFLYYESKQALFRAVVEAAVGPHIEAGQALVEAGTEDPVHLVRSLLMRYWEVFSDPRLEALPRLVAAEAGNFPELAGFFYENVILRARSLFISALERGIREGVFRPCNAGLMCRLAVAPLMSDGVWRRLMPKDDPLYVAPAVFFETYLDLFMSSLLAVPAGGRKTDEI